MAGRKLGEFLRETFKELSALSPAFAAQGNEQAANAVKSLDVPALTPSVN